MHKYTCELTLALFVTILASGLGCSNGTLGANKVPDSRTPAQYFKDRQTATVTPHGKIRMNSVEEKDGKIRYQTEDGKMWGVEYSKQADGSYQYGTPETVR